MLRRTNDKVTMKKKNIFAVALAAGLAASAAISGAASAEGNLDFHKAGLKASASVSDKAESGSAKRESGKVALRASGRAGNYGVLISRYATAYGVPVALAHAVIRVESNYRANARGRAGEIGLMQIKPATARAMGYSGSAKGLYNPETNIKFGMKYLAGAHKLGGGSVCGTILKYNAGHGAKRMNPVSARYCAKVKRHMAGS